MLELNSELLAHIESGGTLVVPSRQRATAVRLAHSSALLAAGRRVWNSPDVLPWSAWVERELDFARGRGESLPRRLSAAEEWLLWRDALREACDGHDVLMPDALIEPVRRAVGRLDDYALPLSRAAGAESAVLLRARAAFRRRCTELGALGASSWQDCAAHLRPSEHLLLAGFAALGPARRQWLEQHGARVLASAAPGTERQRAGGAPGVPPRLTQPHVFGCDNPWLEAEAAAHWCAAVLARSRDARLLLVVPRLALQRHLWERALSQRLDAPALLGAGCSIGAAPFAIEGGLPLNAYPLVADALRLIALATGLAPFEQLSCILRSPYFPALDREQCLRLDLWLREQQVGEFEPRQVPRLLASVSESRGPAAAAVLQAVLGGLPDAGTCVAAPAAWARTFAQLLSRCGWPGHAPGSDEQQIRIRFDELLGDFAAIAAPPGRLDAAQASGLLQGMAQRLAFEPASDDVPVTVTASLDDPITRYDGIWVAGLSADVWPPTAQPDALLPLPLQRDAGIPEATAGGQLRLALQRMHQWQQRSRHLALSWSRSDAELVRDRSPLLGEPAATGTAGGFELQAWLQAQAPPLQAWRDPDAAPWPAARALRGGIALLELQSLCPFRAVAELRLHARPLSQPQPGIDPRLRGQLLHLALERFWRATADSATLRSRERDQTLALVQRCVWSASEQLAARLPLAIEARLLRREGARAERLIMHLIEWELAREAFEVRSLEARQLLTLDGASLPVRLDRVDQLADGRLLVIDYKSGVPQAFDAFDPRPPKPQLPAYALAAGPEVAAVMALHLGREGVKARGVTDRPGRAPGRGVEVVADGDIGWRLLQQQWRARLERLMREFLGGWAAVQPQSGACEYCHLQMLCRVDPQVLAAAAVAAADEAPAAQAAKSIESEGL